MAVIPALLVLVALQVITIIVALRVTTAARTVSVSLAAQVDVHHLTLGNNRILILGILTLGTLTLGILTLNLKPDQPLIPGLLSRHLDLRPSRHLNHR